MENIIVAVLALCVYLLPTIIAFKRRHHYKWVICAINVIFGLTGIGYLGAFVWAVWPAETALLDLLANDPTTNSVEAGRKIYGRIGTNVGAFKSCMDADSAPTSSNTPPSKHTSGQDFEDMMRRLAKLKLDGVITQEEFEKKKREIFGT